jgi:hypothetical protein
MLVVSASLLWEWAGALRHRASAKPSN